MGLTRKVSFQGTGPPGPEAPAVRGLVSSRNSRREGREFIPSLPAANQSNHRLFSALPDLAGLPNSESISLTTSRFGTITEGVVRSV